MPDITLTLSDATVARLGVVVADYNGQTGQDLTLEDYLDLHVRELAIQRELVTKVEQLKRQTETDLHAALEAEKQRLLTAVAVKEDA